MSQAIRRPPGRRLRWLWAAALLQLGCTNACSPDLTAEQIAPYTSCAIDGDCVVDNAGCSSCKFVAVNAGKKAGFEELRGCWPGPAPTDCVNSCSAGRCVHGVCQVTNLTNCFQGELTLDGGAP